MVKSNKLTKQITSFCGIGILLLSISADILAATVEFNANIAFEGECEISFPNEVIFNSGAPILPNEIVERLPVATETFDLTLTNCKGIGVIPKIMIEGESTSAYGNTLFLNSASSTSVGYGVLLKFDGNTYFQQNPNLAINKVISVIDNWDINTNLTLINGTLPITAILSCGDCNTDGRIGGDLKANVTFDFQYD